MTLSSPEFKFPEQHIRGRAGATKGGHTLCWLSHRACAKIHRSFLNRYLPKNELIRVHKSLHPAPLQCSPCAHAQESSVLGLWGVTGTCGMSLCVLGWGGIKSHQAGFSPASAQHRLDMGNSGALCVHFSINLWPLQRCSGVPDASKAAHRL